MFGLMTPDVATPAGYAAVQECLDVDNLIDFVLTHHVVERYQRLGLYP